ncbi:MAG TPA: S9 family peptidase [Acidobacteriota bacterium]|jgi:dipeptidyl aminopeptidase/acylaminoacyl peptidase
MFFRKLMLFLSIPWAAMGWSALHARNLQSGDLYRLRSVTDVRLSPDGSRIAYVVSNNDRTGRPYSQIWIQKADGGEAVRVGGDKDSGSDPEWSPDNQWIAFDGHQGSNSGLMIVRADGSGVRFLAPMSGTNSPLPTTGKTIAWAPDGKRIAYVSSTPGPETSEATGDPIVITRYLYKPDADEGLTRFNDNRRLHIFLMDVASGRSRQLTSGDHYEHSVDWSPAGEEIAFISNREPNEDQFFNYDLLVLKVADGSMRRLTATESAEYRARWSPDGKTIAYLATRRGLTDLETTMEDTHVWLIDADGSNRRELGAAIDNRQGTPQWSADGKSVLFTVQQRGNVRLYRMGVSAEQPEVVIDDRGSVGAWSIGPDGSIAYAFAGPTDLAQLYLKKNEAPARQVTDLNATAFQGVSIAPVESFTFISNDNKYEMEAFLTRPLAMTTQSKHPLIVVIHGGPHGQQGPAFNFKNQVYAALGWATLMVNYRGSTGYGQKFTDAVFSDQNGNEAQDVLYGLSAAMRRNLWIDRDRLGVEGGSYGGQLSAWLITQTRIFKAAIPLAAIINLVSYNYTTYYNQYEQMEFGILPHQGNMMDVLWERSALKHVAKVSTPTLLLHGENDNDVPIMEAEQFYVALKDVGVDTVMVRYPREGHGLREPRHVVDAIDRSVKWYQKYFPSEQRPQ